MSIILMTTLFYKALILQGEIWCWSLLGLKGLTRLQCQDWGHRAGSENQILPKTKLNSGHLRIAYSGYSTTIPYESVEEEERGTFFAPNGNSEKVRAPYGIQPTTLRDLVGCSNHWVTYWILDGEQRWTCHVLLLQKTHLVVGWLNLRYAFMWLHDAVMSHTCLSWFDYVTALDRVSSGSVVRASD